MGAEGGAVEEGEEPSGEGVVFSHVGDDDTGDDDLAACIPFTPFFLGLGFERVEPNGEPVFVSFEFRDAIRERFFHGRAKKTLSEEFDSGEYRLPEIESRFSGKKGRPDEGGRTYTSQATCALASGEKTEFRIFHASRALRREIKNPDAAAHEGKTRAAWRSFT